MTKTKMTAEQIATLTENLQWSVSPEDAGQTSTAYDPENNMVFFRDTDRSDGSVSYRFGRLLGDYEPQKQRPLVLGLAVSPRK